MRCIFTKGKQKELILFARDLYGLSWREMASKLRIGSSTLRDWRDEKYLMHYRIFCKIVKAFPQREGFRTSIIGLKEDNWGRQLGGFRTRQISRGFFDPKYAQQQHSWKSNGGRVGLRNWHTQMKANKPGKYHQMQQEKLKKSLQYKYKYHNQKYRNILELNVAEILTENDIRFEYEHMIKCEGKFYLPDFTLDNVILECTYWHDVEQRARELCQKIEAYAKSGFSKTIVVTIQKYKHEYSRLLQGSNTVVITSEDLREILGGRTWAGRESLLNSLPKLSTDRAPALWHSNVLSCVCICSWLFIGFVVLPCGFGLFIFSVIFFHFL